MNDQNNNGNYYNPNPNMYPPQQQQPYQAHPQPQYPVQGYPQYSMPQQPYQGQPMQAPMPSFGQGIQQPMQPQQPPMLQSIPQYYRPDEQAMLQAYQQQRTEMVQGGSGYRFVKFLGPNGEDKWTTVPINYTAVIRVYVLPPWAPGKNIFAISKSHFYKSAARPLGANIACPGPQTCKICQAKVQALDSGNAVLQKKAKDFGRVRTQFFYQVALLDRINDHLENGQMVPYILGAGSNLHSAIGNLIEDKGISIFDPQNGRPLKIKKTKTGPADLNVEYKCGDEDPSPLPQVFWSLLNNLINLEQVNKMPTDQEMIAAIQEMGLVLSPYGGPNPYEAQTPVNQPPYNPMPNIPPMMPPQQPVNPMPNMVQPVQPQLPMGPPLLQPPPVTSDGSGQGYAPQPSQQQQTQQDNAQSNPNPGFVRQPIQTSPQNNAPKTLEQLQQDIKGNQ